MTAPTVRLEGRDRRAALLEVAVGFGALELALWSSRTPQIVLGALAIAYIVAVTLRHSGVEGAGLARRHAGRGWWLVLVAIGGAGMMLLTARHLGTLHLRIVHRPLLHTTLYAVWAFVQEFMLQSFLLSRFERAIGDARWACVASATLFAVAHLPNPILVPLTFAVGLGFTLAFQRYRSLYAIAVAHALLGMAVAASVPDRLTHFMRVGAAY